MRTSVAPFSMVALAATLLVSPSTAQQADSLVDRPLATRDELTALVKRIEGRTRPDSAGAALARRVQQRLADGDLRPGDRVAISVQGESALTDTFTVGPDRDLLLPPPAVGTLSVRGLLRSEIQSSTAKFVSEFVRNPVVRARPLMRISVQGEVERPGYHAVPADAVLADVLMAAGGTTPTAELKKARLERDGESLLEGEALRRAIASGSTLDQTHIRDGDQIMIPRHRDGGIEGNLRFLWIIVSLTGGIYGLSRAF